MHTASLTCRFGAFFFVVHHFWPGWSQIQPYPGMQQSRELREKQGRDPRVELCPTGSSRAAQSRVAKPPGPEDSHTVRYSAVRKRAFRRARRRAEQHGGTYYHGRWMSAEALGTRSVGTSQTMASAKPRPIQQAKCRPTARLRVRSYNLGGVSGPVYDHLHFWLTTACKDDVVILQELHWGCGRAEATWTIPGWSMVVSADPQQRFAGVGILISNRVAAPDNISYTSSLPGRLLHVRCTTTGKTLDVIAGYQWVRTEGGTAATTEKRSKFWMSLGTLLHSIPTRNLVVVGADFNTQCRPVSGLIGRGTLQTCHQPDPEFEALLNEHQLVLLNTWGRSARAACHTYRFDDVYSQIDFIAMRRPTADHTARLAKPVPFDLAPWREGAKHRAVLASIPWRAGWTFQPKHSPSVKFSPSTLRQSLRNWDSRAQELQAWVQHTLNSATPDTTLKQLNERMLSHHPHFSKCCIGAEQA